MGTGRSARSSSGSLPASSAVIISSRFPEMARWSSGPFSCSVLRPAYTPSSQITLVTKGAHIQGGCKGGNRKGEASPILEQRPHLSKSKSNLKQKFTQLLTPFSGTVFHALSPCVIHFVRSVSFKTISIEPVPENDVRNCVHFCLKPLMALERCVTLYVKEVKRVICFVLCSHL